MEIRKNLLLLTLIILFGLILPNFSPAKSAGVFLRNLSEGSVGEDVRNLQILLNKRPETRLTLTGPGSPGNETNYFGPLTTLAVSKYQEFFYDTVLKPLNLYAGTGFFGQLTRNKAETDYVSHGEVSNLSLPTTNTGTNNQANTPPLQTSLPTIISVSPTYAKAGTEITLYGTGFESSNIVYASFAKLENVPSYDGKTIKFIVKEPFPDSLFVPDFLRVKYKEIQYGFYIENSKGKSNQILFKLDITP